MILQKQAANKLKTDLKEIKAPTLILHDSRDNFFSMKHTKGVVFGRNALQRENPIMYQRALIEVVKRGMSPAEAVKQFKL